MLRTARRLRRTRPAPPAVPRRRGTGPAIRRAPRPAARWACPGRIPGRPAHSRRPVAHRAAVPPRRRTRTAPAPATGHPPRPPRSRPGRPPPSGRRVPTSAPASRRGRRAPARTRPTAPDARPAPATPRDPAAAGGRRAAPGRYPDQRCGRPPAARPGRRPPRPRGPRPQHRPASRPDPPPPALSVGRASRTPSVDGNGAPGPRRPPGPHYPPTRADVPPGHLGFPPCDGGTIGPLSRETPHCEGAPGMRVCVVGTGYVGLTTGASLAFLGHKVTCLDIDEAKVELLRGGTSPIYEPYLDELLAEAAPNLRFTADYAEAVAGTEVVFVAVQTPQLPDGGPDLRYLRSAAESVGEHIGD